MHEYRRFIQQQLDDRGWKRSDLVRKSGLSRQLLWSILTDDRDYLGQMPDDSTIEALSIGFGLPAELFRTAAARSLVGYIDDGVPLTIQLQNVSTDALLNEVRRRIDENRSRIADTSTPAGTQTEGRQTQEAAPSWSTERAGTGRVAGNQLEDSRGVPAHWLPDDHPGVVGRPGDDRRDQSGSG